MAKEKKTTGQEQIDDEGDLIYLDDTPNYWEITNVQTLRKLIAYLYEVIAEMEMDLEDSHDENTALFNKYRAVLKENQELKIRLVDKIVEDEANDKH